MAASGLWRRFVLWFRRHAPLSIALAVGLAFGIGCRYPAGWALPDNTMAVFAAIIGALVTAAAVVIGVELQSGREEVRDAARQAELRMRLKITLQPFFVVLRNCHRDLGDPAKRTWAARRLVEQTDAITHRVQSSRVITEGLDNAGLVALSYVETTIAAILPTARGLVIVTELCDAMRASPGGIHRLMNDLAMISNELMDQVFTLAGGDSLDEWKLPIP